MVQGNRSRRRASVVLPAMPCVRMEILRRYVTGQVGWELRSLNNCVNRLRWEDVGGRLVRNRNHCQYGGYGHHLYGAADERHRTPLSHHLSYDRLYSRVGTEHLGTMLACDRADSIHRQRISSRSRVRRTSAMIQ